MILLNTTMLLLWSIVLAVSGSYLVKGLSKMSEILGLEEFSVGFIIMAIATSIPEIMVGVYSAMLKNSALSLGNVIGSNIVDLTLVGGILVLLSGGKIKMKSKTSREDTFWASMISVLPLILFFAEGSITRLDGIFLIIVFGLYIRKKILESKKFRKRYEENEKQHKKKEMVKTLFILAISLTTLLISSKLVVTYAENVSIELSLPPILIGLILIAIGTSLPELAFGVQSAISKHPELSLGDLTGSVVANSTLVLGITALIYPIYANTMLFLTSGMFMFIITFLFSSFVESGHELDWKEGLSLVFLYIFFLILEVYLNFIPA